MQLLDFKKYFDNGKIDLESEIITLRGGYSQKDYDLFMELIGLLTDKGYITRYAIYHPSGYKEYTINRKKK